MHSITRLQIGFRANGPRIAAALLGLLLVAAVLQPLPRASALTTGAREFSTEEARRLRAGLLVVRPSEVERGGARLMGGLSWQLISASPARVWRTIADVRTYTHFLPACEEARFIDQLGGEQRYFIRHRLGFVNASYFVLTKSEPSAGRLRFRLDRSRASGLRDAFGELRVTAYPEGKSVVSLAILADVGEGLIAGLVRSNVHEWMLRVPEQLKKYIEQAEAEGDPAGTPNATADADGSARAG